MNMFEAKDLIKKTGWKGLYFTEELKKYLGEVLDYFPDLPLPPLEAMGESTI